MRLSVKVVANARIPRIVSEDGNLKVYLTSPPVNGKANIALIAVLAKYYFVKVSQITIIKGLKSHHKIINIDGI